MRKTGQPKENNTGISERALCNLLSGTERDIINPDEIIGYGNIYSDRLYYWTDVFTNYVDKYNVPVPAEFRKRIMSNYESRRKRHMLLRW